MHKSILRALTVIHLLGFSSVLYANGTSDIKQLMREIFQPLLEHYCSKYQANQFCDSTLQKEISKNGIAFPYFNTYSKFFERTLKISELYSESGKPSPKCEVLLEQDATSGFYVRSVIDNIVKKGDAGSINTSYISYRKCQDLSKINAFGEYRELEKPIIEISSKLNAVFNNGLEPISVHDNVKLKECFDQFVY